jgi:hypothetical protein
MWSAKWKLSIGLKKGELQSSEDTIPEAWKSPSRSANLELMIGGFESQVITKTSTSAILKSNRRPRIGHCYLMPHHGA